MLIQEAALAHLVSHILVEGGGVQVRGLLGHHQLADDLLGGAITHARRRPGASSLEKVLR